MRDPRVQPVGLARRELQPGPPGPREVAVVKVITPKTGEGVSMTQLFDSDGKLIGTVRADRTTQGYEVTATLDPSVQARLRQVEKWSDED